MSNDIFFRRFVNLPCSFPSSVLIININGETQTQEIASLGGDWHGFWDAKLISFLPLVYSLLPIAPAQGHKQENAKLIHEHWELEAQDISYIMWYIWMFWNISCISNDMLRFLILTVFISRPDIFA